jgi:hypothetical protein
MQPFQVAASARLGLASGAPHHPFAHRVDDVQMLFQARGRPRAQARP